MTNSKFPRVVLKLSGEVLAGEGGSGLCPKTLDETASQLARALKEGARAGAVLGGGNIFRGLGAAADGMDRVYADSMGMLATAINGLALVDAVKRNGAKAKLFTAFQLGPIGNLYRRDQVQEAMDQNILAVLAGGTGNPYFSTDSAAALRAAELGCEVLQKGTKVDGVYDKDPAKHKDAKRYDQLSINDMIEQRLGVVDLTAATLCRENKIDLRVYKMTEKDAIYRATMGEPLGTFVKSK